MLLFLMLLIFNITIYGRIQVFMGGGQVGTKYCTKYLYYFRKFLLNNRNIVIEILSLF